MPYKEEKEMYYPVTQWLQRFLQGMHKRATIRVFDSSDTSLTKLINDNGLIENLPPEWQSWDIHVDVVGFIITAKKTELAFVECKNIELTLAHLSQLLGYSRIAKPRYSFLISPIYVNSSVLSLLSVYQRLDVLDYYYQKGSCPRSMIIAKWDERTNAIDNSKIITSDYNHTFLF